MRDDPKWNIEFVKVVEKHPVLYDAGSERYSSKDSVDTAWKEVADQMGESVINCKEKWRNLRTSLTRHLRNMNEPSTLSGKYRKPYYMASYMAFLIPFTKTRSYQCESPPLKLSNDSSFDRRLPERTDSSSYDNIFGLTNDDSESTRGQIEDESHEQRRKRAKMDLAGGMVAHGDTLTVQPKLEILDSEEGEDLYGDTDGEQEGATGGSKRAERRVENSESEAAISTRKQAAVSAMDTGDRAAESAQTTSSATLSVIPGPAANSRPRKTCDGWEVGQTQDFDDESFSGGFREEGVDGEAWRRRDRRRAESVRWEVGRGKRAPESGGHRIGLLEEKSSRNFAIEHSSADMDFFRSILPDVSSLTPSQRSRFRMSVLSTLHNILYD